MSRNLSKNPKLLVISDTGMYQSNSAWYAFGPVVKELDYFLSVCSEITWIGFNRTDQKGNLSYTLVDEERIKIIALKKVGGTNLMSKVHILRQYPSMWLKIKNEVKQHDYIHVRAPSNPSIIAMYLSKIWRQKKFWFKYAGSWIDKASKSYDWQRKQLKKLKSNSVVTVNGRWDNQPAHVMAFDNPCLEEDDRDFGKEIIVSKQKTRTYSLCFVGGINHNKGILNLIAALRQVDASLYDKIEIVGDGPLKEELLTKSEGIRVVYHGLLSKAEVVSVYERCHFIVLPSKSEGFPKVISEAMNYGCVPIVSNVSGIPQVISTENGFLLDSLEATAIAHVIANALSISKNDYKSIIAHNYELAQRFTYNIYIERMSKEIFNFDI